MDAVAAGLAGEAAVKIDRLPRMADFAIWVTACEKALGWGYGQVYYFRDGYPAWKTAGLPVE
jgi:hypothetical protein